MAGRFTSTKVTSKEFACQVIESCYKWCVITEKQLLMHVGKTMRHELTGSRIKLLTPMKQGWSVQFLAAPNTPAGLVYTAYVDTDTLSKSYLDVEVE